MAVGPDKRRKSYAIPPREHHRIPGPAGRLRLPGCSSPPSRCCLCSSARAGADHRGAHPGHRDGSERRRGAVERPSSSRDVQRGTSRTRPPTTPEAYAVPDLQPGTYKIHVEAKGFKSVERPNVQIEVATDVRADFALQPGQVTEMVTSKRMFRWSTRPPSTLGGTLSNKEINDLPLNGRNYENLLQLRPGVDALSRRRILDDEFATDCARKTTPTSLKACSTASRIPARRSSTAPASRAIPRRFCRSTRSRNSTCSRIRQPNMGGSRVRWSTLV